MSLGVAIKGPEGIVLAADSRVTLEARPPGQGVVLPIFYDNASKLLSFEKQRYVGAVTYGQAVIGRRTAHSLLPELELSLGEKRLPVGEFAEALSDFFLARWRDSMPKTYDGPQITFVVAGFDPDEPYGEVHLFDIPGNPKPTPRTPKGEFGMTWGGQLDIASRIFHGYDPSLIQLLAKETGQPESTVCQWLQRMQPQLSLPIPWEFLPLQDCINLATAMIRTTMVFQNAAIRLRGVGGPVDVAVITRIDGLQFIQRKKLAGELAYPNEGGTGHERA